MALEQFKTQVLLLHSQQSTLDALSAGFGDRYAVHLATSGSEALTTLGETPIHVIVSAQDLPGMSGLEALREARKRSPDTIGILLAGSDRNDGLEALVSDKEVFQIVRGTVSPDALRDIIDTATQRLRLLTLSESANDLAANVDEPQGEYIIMETSPQGSSIVSDGSARLSVLKPRQAHLASSAGGREIDVLVLTKDENFLETIRDSSLELHTVHHANTPAQAEAAVRDNKVGVLVTDAAMVGDQISALTERLRKDQPRLVAVVAGRRDDGELLMDLINRGQVYRFLLKPVSPGRARLAIEASVKYHLEAPDAAFRNKANAEAPAGGDTSKARPARESAGVTPISPDVRPAPKVPGVTVSTPSVTQKTAAKRAPAKTSQRRPAVPPLQRDKAPSAPTGSAAKAPGFGGVADPARVRAVSASRRLADWRRRSVAVGTGVAAVAALGWWFTRPAPDATEAMPDQTLEATSAPAADASPSVVESDIPIPPRGSPARQRQELPAAPPAWQETLHEARIARDAGEIVAPPGSNAVELYAAVRALAPEDPVIASEFSATVEDAIALAEEALLQQNPAAAADTLRVVRLADPGNARLPFLDAQVAGLQLRRSLDQARLAIRERRFEDAAGALQRAQSAAGTESDELQVLKEELDSARSEQALDEVLLLAGERLEQNALIAPANDNARYYYELALSTAPENTVARQGLTIVAGKLVLGARESIDLGRLDEAERLLGDAAALDAQSADLSASLQALENAREARQAALDAEAEAARQAELEREAALRAEAEAQRQAELEREARLRAEAEAEHQAELEREAALQAEAAEDESLPGLPEAGVANFPHAVSGENLSSSLRPAALAEDSSADAASSPVAGSRETLYSTTSFRGPAADGVLEEFPAEDGAPVAASAAPPEPEPEYVAISTLTRTNYVAPEYPRSAQRRNITGWVDVAFTVNIRGSVENIRVLDSGPGDIFVDAASRAVAQWHFEPTIVNRRPVEKQVAIRLNFSLE